MTRYIVFIIFIILLGSCKNSPDIIFFKDMTLRINNRISQTINRDSICFLDSSLIMAKIVEDSFPKVLHISNKYPLKSCVFFQKMTVEHQDATYFMADHRKGITKRYYDKKYEIQVNYSHLKSHYLLDSIEYDKLVRTNILNLENRLVILEIYMLLPVGVFD